MAAKLGMSRSAYHARDTGKIDFNLEERERAAEVLGLDVDELHQLAKLDHGGFVPVVGTASAGVPVEYDGHDAAVTLPSDNAYAIIIDGESMAPLMKTGDVAVMVAAGSEWATGVVADGAVICVHFSDDSDRPGESVIGRFYGEKFADGRAILTKDNTRFAPVYFRLEDVARAGVLQHVHRRQ